MGLVLSDPLLPHITDCGIPGIRSIPYGVHLCHFYPTRQDLIDGLVPFFVSGLQNNERCVWVTADPLPAHDAKAELAKVMPDVDAALRDGRLRILAADEWYGIALKMSGDDMIELWLRQEEKALGRGFRGLRVTGNTSFLTPDTWDSFMEYESAISRALEGRRIVALCSYDQHQCRATEMRDVMRHHHYALDRADPTWQVSEAPFPL